MTSTTVDANYPNRPLVQPVFIEGAARQYDLLLKAVHLNETTSFQESTVLQLARYRRIHVVVQWTASSGTSPTLQVDLVEVLPDSTQMDYYNAGAKTGGFSFDYGGGVGNNAPNAVLPEQLTFSYSFGGTSPNISFTVWVWGEM